MGKKKDIGAFIESKLSGGKNVANDKVWNKINQSLDRENYQPKRNHFYWVAGGTVLLSLGIFLLVVNENFYRSNLPVEENDKTITIQSESSSKKTHDQPTIGVSKEDSLNFKKGEEILSETKLAEENLVKIETENSLKTTGSAKSKDSGNRSKKDKPSNESNDQNFTVSTKYYYYNSEDDKQMVTTDKNKIDSLMSGKQETLDSIETKKNDSLPRKTKP